MRPRMDVAEKQGDLNLKQLQWGHGLAAVDAARRMRALPRRAASMGPRPCGRGWPCIGNIDELGSNSFNGATALRPWMVAKNAHLASVDKASMGPRPCGSGWPGCRVLDTPAERASMGPRPCGRGWSARAACAGAVPVLQWGHGLAAVDGSTPAHRMYSDSKLQWGHGLAAVVGASAAGPSPSARGASMGPRPCGRGWVGAKSKDGLARVVLQWGHGLAAVVGCAYGLSAECMPSLQWGHGLAAVVGAQTPRHLDPAPWLQWGHGLAAVVGDAVVGAPAFDGMASMGPRPCGRGWLHHRRRRPPRHSRFNGATALRPWLEMPEASAIPSGRPGFNGATALRPWLARPP